MTTVPLRLIVRRSGRLRSKGDQGLRIEVRVPSALDIVEEALDVVMRHCEACPQPFEGREFSFRVALGEALQNAIIYGNREDPSKSVHVQLRVGERQVEVRVQDEGDGFDPSIVPDPSIPDRLHREEGRGLFLIRQLVDDVSFNDRGNSICMVLRRA